MSKSGIPMFFLSPILNTSEYRNLIRKCIYQQTNKISDLESGKILTWEPKYLTNAGKIVCVIFQPFMLYDHLSDVLGLVWSARTGLLFMYCQVSMKCCHLHGLGFFSASKFINCTGSGFFLGPGNSPVKGGEGLTHRIHRELALSAF
jgi:hypothetical protein